MTSLHKSAVDRNDRGSAVPLDFPHWTARPAVWLLLLFVIALLIRFTHLDAKPAWMDEVSTVIFSLGNSSRMIPLNEVVSLDEILRPLQITPGSTPADAVTNLLAENNHPPAYFALAHVWMTLFDRFFGRADGYASLWGARALSAIFGALAVPATYLLAWFSFRSRLIGILCAALMAVSPFGVFLAQEARHYTLAILMIIASLCCFVLAVQALRQRVAPSWRLICAWVAINTLSIAVHYFSGITILAEALVLLVLLIKQSWEAGASWRQKPWLRIYVAAVGTFVGAAGWLPILINFYGSPQSSFLRSGPSSWQYWVNPVAQSAVGWLYAILSPVTSGYSWQAVTAIVITALLTLLLYAPWLLVQLRRSLTFQLQRPLLHVSLQSIGGFLIAANIIFALICYGLGFDITRGHRYSFVFFPAILILVGAGLAPFWQQSIANFSRVKLPLVKREISGRTFVATVLVVAFFGTQVIVNDLSMLKFYKADRFVRLVQAESTLPVIVGTQTTITEQPIVVGIEILSVAWEIQRQFNPAEQLSRWQSPPRFVIAETNAVKDITAESQLVQSLAAVSEPFDLWLLGFSPDLTGEGCTVPEGGNRGSFRYAHYVCHNSRPTT